ncbi:MAG: monomethylamine:corrinoid methyltransferase, partial [Desulfobacterales bacterium]|nr:monomethylamine:corrinoid methyltransferase [Desulfobacterales bacterium]
MPNFMDFIERANSGPILTEKDFNMESLIPNIRDIVKEYDISLDKENPISSDDAMADRLYEAAIELLARTGIYCEDTNRIIQLDRKEIIQSVQD